MEARESGQRRRPQLAKVLNAVWGALWSRQGGSGRRPRSRVGLIVAITTLVVALFACGAPLTTTLTTLPAADLFLDVRLQGALVPSTGVTVMVVVRYRGTSMGTSAVQFINHQYLTVNGSIMDEEPSTVGTYTATVLHPSAGGRYTIVYTDESGNRTTVIVAAPARGLVITSPAAYAQIPIFWSAIDQLVVHYTIPNPPPSMLAQAPFSTQVDAGVEGNCRADVEPGTPTRTCGVLHVDEPQDGSGHVCASAFGPGGTPTPTPCGVSTVGKPQDAVTGDAVIEASEQGAGFLFSNLAMGPGEVYVHMIVAGTPPQSAFASVFVSMEDVATLPITWVCTVSLRHANACFGQPLLPDPQR